MLQREKWHKSRAELIRTERGTVLAFLQARMGSTRLPGKTLMSIQGQTILERAIRRLRAAPVVDGVVVLTTTLEKDDAVEREAIKAGAVVYRGAELDVLKRFYEAAEKFNPDIVIRATADNPLIDIGSIGRIVQVLHSDLLDLCMEQDLPYGAATEAVRAEALRMVHASARLSRYREHVTLFMKENPQAFRIAYLNPPESLRHPQVRLTIDTMEDFRYMERLISQLPENRHPVALEAYIPLASSGSHTKKARREDIKEGISGTSIPLQVVPHEQLGIVKPDATKL
jgi:spore coat polysaccharide biosynthesis protein SpsF